MKIGKIGEVQENKKTKENIRDRQRRDIETGLLKQVTFRMWWRARDVDLRDEDANFKSPDMPVQVSVRFLAERLRRNER